MTDDEMRIRYPAHRIYVARWGDVGYHLVGPFENTSDACAWASCKQEGADYHGQVASDGANNPNDDPRWQVIWLSSPNRPPHVINPLYPELARQLAKIQLYGAPR